MGTATLIIYHVGGMMAGFGANVVAQNIVVNVGFAASKSKFVRACVCCASMAAGAYVWEKAEDTWHKEVVTADESFKALSEGLSAFMQNRDVSEKKEENVVDGE